MTMRPRHGEMVTTIPVYAVHAKSHTRGQENISLLIEGLNDMLLTSARLRAAGYREIKTLKTGERKLYRKKMDW